MTYNVLQNVVAGEGVSSDNASFNVAERPTNGEATILSLLQKGDHRFPNRRPTLLRWNTIASGPRSVAKR